MDLALEQRFRFQKRTIHSPGTSKKLKAELGAHASSSCFPEQGRSGFPVIFQRFHSARFEVQFFQLKLPLPFQNAKGVTNEERMDAGGDTEREFELPMTSVVRILKRKLPEGVAVSKEAKQAFARAAGIFILYLTSASNAYCKDSKRQTLNAKDVLDALGAIEFDEFVEPLQACLDEMRHTHAQKKKARKTVSQTSPTHTEDEQLQEDPVAEEENIQQTVS